MVNPARVVLALGFILVIGVTFSGCSDSSGSATETTPSDAVTTAAATGALYSAGDVVQSSGGSASTTFLVIGYDSATDSYTRALIFKNSDGSWGYRTDTETQMSKRTVMEKAYPVKVTHVSVSAVPIKIPTTIAATTVTVKRTTTVATATATPALRPSIKDCDPEDGNQDEEIDVEIYGYNFNESATCKLKHSGESDIVGTDVDWISSSQIDCTFEIPDDAAVGAWDIVVTNPDGQLGKLANYFIIHGTGSD